MKFRSFFLAFVVVFCLFALIACDWDNDGGKTEESSEIESVAETNSQIFEPPVDEYETVSAEPGHVHAFGEWVVITEPTCVSYGEKERVCECGMNEIEEIDVLEHTEEVVAAVEPTCTQVGYTEGKKCTVCGNFTVAPTMINKLAHTEIVLEGYSPTCTKEGLTDGSFCTVCQQTIVEQIAIAATNHFPAIDVAVPPTCTSSGLTEGSHCVLCNETLVAQEYMAPIAHNETILKGIEPGCLTPGLTEGKYCYSCKRNTVDQKPIAPLGHLEITDAAVEADCTETGLTAGKHCHRCGTVLVAQEVVEAKGHNYDAENTCTVCFEYKDKELKFTLIGNSYVVSGYDGNAEEIIIPSTYKGLPVVGIEYGAITWVENLRKVTIPKSVISIETNQFLGCNNLVTIIVDKENPVYHSQNNCIIETASKTLVVGCQSSVIPTDGSVIAIGERSFIGCEKLATINIPDGIQYIGDGAFWGCIGLKNVVIPHSVYHIGFESFRDTALESITVPFVGGGGKDNAYFEYLFGAAGHNSDSGYVPETLKNVVVNGGNIGDNAFSDCEYIESVYLHRGVTSIGEYAFENCVSLKSINIRDGILSIGFGAFLDCASLTDVVIGENSQLGYIGEAAFSGCTNLVSIVIPDGVKSINANTFGGCVSLESITLHRGIESVENYAFSGCSSLASVTFEEGSELTSIGVGAFENCASLNSIAIPAMVSDIGDAAFSCCGSLESITVDVNNTDYYSYENCLIETRTKILVLGCKNSEIPSDGAIEAIGANAFRGCYDLEALVIPEGVLSIGANAFSECTSLSEMNIPESVMEIGSGAFYGCISYLEEEGGVCYADKWVVDSKGETSEVTLRSDTLGIADTAFYYDTALESIVIPEGVVAIGYEAFACCSNLKSVSLPSSIYFFGIRAFTWCTGLVEVNFADGFNPDFMGFYAFEYCTGLESVTVPEGLETISIGMFYGCANLRSIVVPVSMQAVNEDAFAGCKLFVTVNYAGAEDDWKKIAIQSGNEIFEKANIIFEYNK